MAYEIGGFAVAGKFTEAEWARLLDMIREVEQTRPHEPFRITVHTDGSATMDEAEALLRSTWASSPDPDVALEVRHIPDIVALPVLGPGADDPEDLRIGKLVRRQLLRLTTQMSRDLAGVAMGGAYLEAEEAYDLGILTAAVVMVIERLKAQEG